LFAFIILSGLKRLKMENRSTSCFKRIHEIFMHRILNGATILDNAMQIPKPDIPITINQLKNSTTQNFPNPPLKSKPQYFNPHEFKAPLAKKQPVPILIGNS